jgi:hypothetical protein
MPGTPSDKTARRTPARDRSGTASPRRRRSATVAPVSGSADLGTDVRRGEQLRDGQLDGSGPAIIDPIPEVVEAPAIVPPKITHKVARCRWCAGKFERIYTSQWICGNGTCADRCVEQAMAFPHRDAQESPWFYLPLPMQVDGRLADTTHLLIAGAAGSSKSHGMRMDFYHFCRTIRGFRGLLLRCTYDELYKNHLQFCAGEAAQLGDAKFSGGGGGQPKQMAFPDQDSILFFGYCEHDADIARHLGAEYDGIGFEEAVTFLPRAINEITPRARGATTSRAFRESHGLPNGFTRLASNPGGRAMLYLHDHYVTRKPDVEDYPGYDPSLYGHIIATLDDNPYLAEDYERRNLSGLSAARYQQLRYGNWNVFAGQFFDSYDPAIHVVSAA